MKTARGRGNGRRVKGGSVIMPMTMNVDEAGIRFRDIVLTIERNQSPYMIMDGDRPVAQIVPVPARRKIVTIPELAGSISKEDLFSDDSELWGAVNA